MKFDKSTQRRARVAAITAFVMWCILLGSMFIGSTFLHKNPTARWLALLGPLCFVFAADEIINSEWHSKTWTAVEHTPEFYVWLGILVLMFAVVLTVTGMASWSTVPWFD